MNNKLFFAAAALLLVGCGPKTQSGAPQAAQEPQAEKVQLVSVITAAAEEVPQTSVYSSTVQANVVNNIAPQAGGRIQKLNVEIGDFVSKGQVLAEMDRVQLEQATLKLRNDETELERVRALLAQGGISQADFDQLELACKVSRSSYENLLENTVLRSPVSGVVTACTSSGFARESASSHLRPVRPSGTIAAYVPVHDSTAMRAAALLPPSTGSWTIWPRQ